MTRNRAAIAIAQDVLKHLRYLRVEPGTYVSGPKFPGFNPADDAKKHLSKIRKNCEVCALGACFLSYVGLYDKIKLGELDEYGHLGNLHISANYDNMMLKLKSVLGNDQVVLIESAFELSDMREDWTEHDEGTPDTIEEAIAFGEKFKEPKKRLSAIMRNMVINGGNFKPGKNRTNRIKVSLRG